MKTRVPEFINIYNSLWPVDNGISRWSSSVWNHAFGNDGKLPADGGQRILINHDRTLQITVMLKPIGPKGSSRRHHCKHRAFVKCPRCSNLIPAGRIHQHTCK